jgi:hypothetical protein
MTQTEITIENDDFLISLTLHNFSTETIKEFARKIVKPYFGGNLNQAIRTLMENAINEETITNKVMAKENRNTSSELR